MDRNGSALKEALKNYVSHKKPFGPVDSSDVTEPECSSRLYEWQNSAFAELLRGSHVIIGRRGSGKSALIRMVRNTEHIVSSFKSDRGREYREVYGVSLSQLNVDPALVIEVNLPQQMFEMELQFSELGITPKVEIVAQHWITRIYFLIGDQIRAQDSVLWKKLSPKVQRYVTAADLVELDPSDHKLVMSVKNFGDEIRKSLIDNDKKVILTFDSLEEYKFDSTQNMVLAGLFRAAGQLIALQRSPVDIKLCLPAEMFEFLKPSILNPDKDTTQKQFLHWTAPELMHVAAHRLKVYFDIFDEDEYRSVFEMRLHDRSQLKAFWARYLPKEITNGVGTKEDTFRYILRHTQMLPRHVIMILNSIFLRAMKNGRRGEVSERHVIEGVKENEPMFSDTITKMFEVQYPAVRQVLKRVLPRLPRVLTFGTLQKIWREDAEFIMAGMDKREFWEFSRLMLSTGAIGVVDRDQTSSIYISARFEFNTEHDLVISDKDQLCIHPIFSGIYNATMIEDKRVILPRGSDHGLSPVPM